MSDSQDGSVLDSTKVAENPVFETKSVEDSELEKAAEIAQGLLKTRIISGKANVQTSGLNSLFARQFGNIQSMDTDKMQPAVAAFAGVVSAWKIDDQYGESAKKVIRKKIDEEYTLENGVYHKRTAKGDLYRVNKEKLKDKSCIKQYSNVGLEVFANVNDVQQSRLEELFAKSAIFNDISDRELTIADVDNYIKAEIVKLLGQQLVDNISQKTLNADRFYTGKSFMLADKENKLADFVDLLYAFECAKIYFHIADERRGILNEKLPKPAEVVDVSGITEAGISPVIYDQQGINNCFCCSGAGIYNRFAKSDGNNRLTQDVVRKYEPEYLSPEEIQTLTKKLMDASEEEKKHIQSYANKDSVSIGNFFGVSDIIFDTKNGFCRNDLAVHSMVFTLSMANTTNRVYATFEAMKTKFHEILKTDQFISVLRQGHYLTVVGLNGENVFYLDSNCEDSSVVKCRSFKDFIFGGNSPYVSKTVDIEKNTPSLITSVPEVQIHWISKLEPKDKDKMMREFTSLEVNDEGKISRKGKTFTEFDVSHRYSTIFRKHPKELEQNRVFGDMSDIVSEYVALPNTAFLKSKDGSSTGQPQAGGGSAASKRQVEKKKVASQPKVYNEEDRWENEPLYEHDKEPLFDDEDQAEKEPILDEEDRWGNEPLYEHDEEPLFDDDPQLKAYAIEFSNAALKSHIEKTAGIFDRKNEEDRKAAQKKKKQLLVLPKFKDVFAFDRGFKIDPKLDAAKRQTLAGKKRDELFKKHDLKQKTEAIRTAWETERNSQKKALPEKIDKALDEQSKNSLLPFIIGDQKADSTLAMLFSDTLLDESFVQQPAIQMIDEVEEKAHAEGVKILIGRLVSVSVKDIDLSSDDAMLKSGVKLEQIGRMLEGFEYFTQKFPAALVRIEGERESKQLLADFSKKIEEIRAVSEYYEAKKALIANPDYASHYDRELGIICSKDDEQWKKDIAKQLLRVRNAAEQMSLVLGRESKGELLSISQGGYYLGRDMDMAVKTMEVYFENDTVDKLAEYAEIRKNIEEHETSNHSSEYINFRDSYYDFLKRFRIAARMSTDGKELSVDELLIMREAYDRCISRIDQYLDSKRKYLHSKTLYERFDIMRNLKAELTKDYEKILSVPADKPYDFLQILNNKKVDLTDQQKQAAVNDIIKLELRSDDAEEDNAQNNTDIAVNNLGKEIDRKFFDYVMGAANAEDLLKYTGVISERIAYSVLMMTYNRLDYRLGNLVDKTKKKEIWDRVSKLQTKINDIVKSGKRSSFTIVSADDMVEYVREGKSGVWRVPLEEYDIKIAESNGENFDALIKSDKKADFIQRLASLEREFDTKIGSYFSGPIEGLEDSFYIDGKSARDYMGDEIELKTRYARSVDKSIFDQKFAKDQVDKTNEGRIRELVTKALLIECAQTGKHIITIASRQEDSRGHSQLVVTDLNISIEKADGTVTPSSVIEKKRKKRVSNFAKIRKDISDKRINARQDEVLNRIRSREFANLSTVFQEASNQFIVTIDRARSDEFIAVKRALAQIYKTDTAVGSEPAEQPLVLQLESGNVNWTTANYAKFTRLMEALSHFIASGPVDMFTRSEVAWFQAAINLREKLNEVVVGKITKQATQPPALGTVSDNEKTFAIKNVKRMSHVYRTYAARIGEDPIATDDEKLQRKWNLLKNLERDILIFNAENLPDMEFDWQFITNEYFTVRWQITLREKLKKEGVVVQKTNQRTDYIMEKTTGHLTKPEEHEHSDANLRSEQLAGLRQIDHWILRNFRNGGMSAGLYVADRTDLLDTLMAMSHRQRLYIYDLVENGGTKKQEGFKDIVHSQTDYIPDLKKFKKQMLTPPIDLIDRTTGEYIFWDKITSAIGFSRINIDDLDAIDEYYTEKEKAKTNPLGAIAKKSTDTLQSVGSDLMKTYKTGMYGILDLTLEIKNLLIQAKTADQATADNLKKQIGQKTEDLKKRISEVTEQHKYLFEELRSYDLEGKDTESGAGSVSESVETAFVCTSYVSKLEKISDTIGQLSLSSLSEVAASPGTVYSENSIGLLGDMADLVFSGIKLVKNWESTRESDRASVICKGLLSLGEGVRTATDIAKTAGDASTATMVITGQVIGMALSVGDAVYTSAMIGKNVSRRVYRKSAIKIAEKASMEEKAAILNGKKVQVDKHREGLIRLDKIITRRERAQSITKGISSTVGLSAAIVAASVALAPLTSGMSLAIGLGGLSLAAGSKVLDNDYVKEKRYEVIASLYDVDSMMDVALKEWAREHDKEEMSERQRSHLRERILFRIAGSLGFHSPRQLADHLAQGYGEYLLDGLRTGTRQHKEMCFMMISGLGLRIEWDSKTNEIVTPKASDIASKLTD